MATVYLAHDLKHDRNVAIKVLRPELASALGPERFLREIQTTANLRHPHILPLYDSGEAAGFLYYVIRSSRAKRCATGCTGKTAAARDRLRSEESTVGVDTGGPSWATRVSCCVTPV
jgi:hypothetical protein